eukprot:SAG11_NODE_56_length_19295_cov_20.219675_9_plen_134_part_00
MRHACREPLFCELEPVPGGRTCIGWLFDRLRTPSLPACVTLLPNRGDDSANQKAAAAGMGVVASEISATQVIALGDNFYHSADSHCGTAGGHYGGICNNNTDGSEYFGAAKLLPLVAPAVHNAALPQHLELKR